MKNRQIYARATEQIYRYWQEIAAITGETPSDVLRRLIIEEHAKLSQEARDHDHRTNQPTSRSRGRRNRIFVDKEAGEEES